MRRLFFSIPLLLLSPAVFGQAPERSPKWASPVAARYLKNAYQLDAKVYRSAQPSRKGFEEAKRMGITDVLNLRDRHSDEAKAAALGLHLHQIKAEADEITEKDIRSALRLIRQARGPVLVHCWHGSDRTGAVCAMYRIVFNDWSKEEALNEMVNGGFGYHKIYANIIRLIQGIHVQKIKEQVFAP